MRAGTGAKNIRGKQQKNSRSSEKIGQYEIHNNSTVGLMQYL